ncbi:chemerin-like receptor 1 [Discoglossus pictus]
MSSGSVQESRVTSHTRHVNIDSRPQPEDIRQGKDERDFTMANILISENPCNLLLNQEGILELGNGTTSARRTSILQYTSFLLSVLCCVIGLVGNAIVIYITGFKMKKNKSKNWFLNLAVADLVFLIILPINVVSYLKGNWSYGPYVCKMYNFLSIVNIYASIFIISALNIDRVLAVAKPIWHQKFMSARVCYFTCALIWVVTILASLPTAIYSNEHKIGKENKCLLGYIDYSLSKYNLTKCENIEETPTDIIGIQRSVPSEPNITKHNFGDINQYMHGYQENFTREFPSSKVNQTRLFNKSPLFTSSFIMEAKTLSFISPVLKIYCTNKEIPIIWNKMMFTTKNIVITLLVIGFIIPLCVIIICNCIIALKVRKSQTMKLSTLYRIVVTVVLVYFVTWSPLVIAQIIYLVAAQNMNFPLMCKINVILPLFNSIGISNCCLNPVMYVLVSKNVRSILNDSWNSIRKTFSRGSKSTQEIE